MTDMSTTATVCQLLRPDIHPLRALLSFPQFSLVLRQTPHDRLPTAMVQWHVSSLQLFLLSLALGHISVNPRLPGRLGGTALRPCYQELEGSVRAGSRECGNHALCR